MPQPIQTIAGRIGLAADEIELYGRFKAKLSLSALRRLGEVPPGRLVLVTAVSPTPAGEGKTTVAIGLADGLSRLGQRAIVALRQPSLGPVFGRKGGGTGGGRAQLVPGEEINLHFTGDLHAIAAANNLLAALLDNHVYWGNDLDLDPGSLSWRRCLDINDRSLRRVVTRVGCQGEETRRETGFDVTAASEVMAILCLAQSPKDLFARLSRIVIGVNRDGEPVRAESLQAAGAMAALLREALLPNLVQTAEGTPAFVHGGPFGNIAHGCSSVLATRAALQLGDLCVTEAGFGADLGAEKFLDIKARQSGLMPNVAVLIATVRALKLHGGVPLPDLEREDVGAVEAGFPNLARHAENLAKFGLPVVVGINRFASDTEGELACLAQLCNGLGLPAAVVDVWGAGGAGAEALGRLVLQTLEAPSRVRLLYPEDLPLRRKIETVAREIYRAGEVAFLPEAAARLDLMQSWCFGRLPVCIAKAQASFSDDSNRLGAPDGLTLTIRDARLWAGAGFVVAYAGDILTMPGLPREPAAARIGLSPAGVITGVR